MNALTREDIKDKSPDLETLKKIIKGTDPFVEGHIIDPKKNCPEALEFIKKTEGNRPKVDDPRRDVKIKIDLTDEELAKQTEATKEWEKEIKKQYDIT